MRINVFDIKITNILKLIPTYRGVKNETRKRIIREINLHILFFDITIVTNKNL